MIVLIVDFHQDDAFAIQVDANEPLELYSPEKEDVQSWYNALELAQEQLLKVKIARMSSATSMKALTGVTSIFTVTLELGLNF